LDGEGSHPEDSDLYLASGFRNIRNIHSDIMFRGKLHTSESTPVQQATDILIDNHLDFYFNAIDKLIWDIQTKESDL
jgi:hypothetical protein